MSFTDQQMTLYNQVKFSTSITFTFVNTTHKYKLIYSKTIFIESVLCSIGPVHVVS